jgi:hypothetical protein
MITYTYTVAGTAADEQTWEITGSIEATQGNFPLVFNHAMKETFTGLTNGKAIYGNPGIGCSGPYEIVRLVIEAQPIA